jgi:hypothetical protein
MRFAGWAGVCLTLVLGAVFTVPALHAQSETPLQSNNFKFQESAVDNGGMLQSSSANFKVDSAAGTLGVDDAATTNFQVKAGSPTTPDPSLSVSITNPNAAFNDFSASATATATSTFSVSNYTTHGYAVYITGNTPTNGAKSIPGMASNGPSQIGTEQFGLNLVANTTPSVGTNPDNGQFGFGSVSANYNTANSFRYVSGEQIAQSSRNTGITNYTISYITDVASLTPGGKYTANQTIVVTGTY